MAANNKYLYMYVTDDELELPIYVTDSAAELARLIGITPGGLRSSLVLGEKDGRNSRYKRVPIEDII